MCPWRRPPIIESWGPQWVAHEISSPPHYPPGTAWSYAHTNHVILGQALEAIGGEKLGTLITDQIIKPLHLKDTAPALSPGRAPSR
jgi:CubicO group peptidase (beta-lactamase class C family)